MADPAARTLIVSSAGSEPTLVVGVVLEPERAELDELLAALVPELARGGVRAALLVVGEATMVLRNTHQEVTVDDVETAALLALAGIGETAAGEALVDQLERWLAAMAAGWRERVGEGELRELLVPHVVAGLGGEVTRCDGLWGSHAHRVAATTC